MQTVSWRKFCGVPYRLGRMQRAQAPCVAGRGSRSWVDLVRVQGVVGVTGLWRVSSSSSSLHPPLVSPLLCAEAVLHAVRLRCASSSPVCCASTRPTGRARQLHDAAKAERFLESAKRVEAPNFLTGLCRFTPNGRTNEITTVS